MIAATRHTGLVVRDLDRSISFYLAMGMELRGRQTETGAFIEAVVGIQNVRVEWAKLGVGDSHLLELLQYHSHPAEAPMVEAASNKLGCSHMAFTVTDVEAACRLVSELGGSTVNPPALSSDAGVKVAYCHDPDGILMELVEVLAQDG